MNRLALTFLFPLAVFAFGALCVSTLGEILLALHRAYFKQYESYVAVGFALAFGLVVLALATYFSVRKPRPRRPPSPVWNMLDRGMERIGMMTPTANRIYDAIVSGFVATMAMALVLAAAYGIGGRLGSIDSGASFMARWLYYLTHNQLTRTANDALFISILIDVVIGLVWAGAYVLHADHILHAPEWPLWIRRSGWRRGMVFALGPWLLSVVVFLPLAGGGFLGFGLGAGPLPLIGNLILHLVYGGVLGWFYALEDVEEVRDQVHIFEHGPILEHGERGAAIGIVLGVLVGLILGAVINGGQGVVVDGTVLANQVEVMLALAAFLGAGGALVGSMATLHIADEEDRLAGPPSTPASGAAGGAGAVRP